MRLKPLARASSSILKSKLNLQSPFFALYKVTYSCNMKCSICNVWKDAKDYITDELNTQQSLDLITKLSKLGIFFIDFSGGEPLLRKDISFLIKHAKDNGLLTSLNTNGYFIEDRLDDIKDLDYLRVSIDSLKHHNNIRKTENALERAIAGIKKIKQTYPNIRITINAVVMKETLDEMRDLAELAKELKCKISFSPFSFKGSTIDLEAPMFSSSDEVSKYKLDILEFVKQVKFLKQSFNNIENPDFILDQYLTRPICAMNKVAVIIHPDGKFILPCDIYPAQKLASLKDWKQESKKWNPGSLEICKNCTETCALLPSSLLSFKNILKLSLTYINNRIPPI